MSSPSITTTPTSEASSSFSEDSMVVDENAISNNTTPTGPAKPVAVKDQQLAANNKPSGLKPPTNYQGSISALLMNRKKKPLVAKNPPGSAPVPGAAVPGASKIPSTPSNVKRLQTEKWFNSPTDNLFSPCTRKLYDNKKAVAIPLLSCDLAAEFKDDDDAEKVSTDENAVASTEEKTMDQSE